MTATRDENGKWQSDGDAMEVYAAHQMNMAESGELVSTDLDEWGHKSFPPNMSTMVIPQERDRRQALVSSGITTRTSWTHPGEILNVKYEQY